MWATFHYDYWPIVYITLNGDITADGYAAFQKGFLELYARTQPVWVIVDADGVGRVGVAYLAKQARFMKKTEPLSRAHLCKLAIVITDPLHKALLSTLFKLRRPVVPVKLVTDSDTAYKWIYEDFNQQE